jgi:hypothetical protein
VHSYTLPWTSSHGFVWALKRMSTKLSLIHQASSEVAAQLTFVTCFTSGVGGGQHRKMVDSYEDQLSNSATRLERSRLKYERLSKVIISMKAGIGHLQDKLESFREEIKGNTHTVTDDTVTEVLRECELCFVQLNKRIKAGDDEARRAHITDTNADADKGAHSHGPSHVAQAASQMARSHLMGSVANLMPPELDETASRMNTLRPYNQRIDLCKSASIYVLFVVCGVWVQLVF